MYSLAEFTHAGLGFQPASIGRFVGRGTAVDWHLIPSQLIFSCVVSGTAHERTEKHDFLVSPCELVCLRPGRWHSLTEHQGRPLTTIWINLDGPGLAQLPPLFGLAPEQILSSPANRQVVLILFEEMLAAFQDARPVPAAHFLSRFFHLAEICHQGGGEVLPAPPVSLMERAVRLCRTEPMRFPTIPELAARLGVCQNTLLAACRREGGVSAVQLLRRLKLERAMTLLRTTRYKLAVIAKSCGFDSPSHFIRCFREAAGESPAAWRRRMAAG
jgi:AraC-like DNA-binding protein